MLLDSNIVIYAANPASEILRHFIQQRRCAVSSITYVEVMDYRALNVQDRTYFERFFETTDVLPISDAVLRRAFTLRRRRRLKFTDAVIAATALEHGLTLATRNLKDFTHITELSIVNPLVGGLSNER